MNKLSYMTLKLTRKFDVGADKIFDAWVNPDEMYKWLFTSDAGYENRIVENDFRMEGAWSIRETRNGNPSEACGQYLEVLRPHRLVFTFQTPQVSEKIDRMTVAIYPIEKGCEMTFTQNIVVPHEKDWTSEDIENALDECHSQMEQGWMFMFEKLKLIAEE